MNHLSYDELTQMLGWLKSHTRVARREHNAHHYSVTQAVSRLSNDALKDEMTEKLMAGLRPSPVDLSSFPDSVRSVLQPYVRDDGIDYAVLTQLVQDTTTARITAWRKRQDAQLKELSDAAERARLAESEFDGIGGT